MKLQIDSTVIYGIENFNGNLTKNVFITELTPHPIRRVTFPNSTGEVMNTCMIYISASLEAKLDTNGLPTTFALAVDDFQLQEA